MSPATDAGAPVSLAGGVVRRCRGIGSAIWTVGWTIREWDAAAMVKAGGGALAEQNEGFSPLVGAGGISS